VRWPIEIAMVDVTEAFLDRAFAQGNPEMIKLLKARGAGSASSCSVT